MGSKHTADLTLDEAEVNPSLLGIVKDLKDDAVTLFRQEVALAKREVAGKVAQMGRNTALFGAAAFIGLYGTFFMLLGINNLLFAGLTKAGFSGAVSNWFAPVILGMVLCIGAFAIVLKTLRSFRKPLPEKTIQSLKQNGEWAMGKTK